MTSGTSVSSRRETTDTVAAFTRMPGPTSVTVRFSASVATASRARSEKQPSSPLGSPTTGISSMCVWTMPAMAAGTASVT